MDWSGMMRQLITSADGGGGGVVSVRHADRVVFEEAWGLADRRFLTSMTTSHRLGLASGSKAFTALVVMSLVQEGLVDLTTPARSVLQADLPLIDDRVTLEHLLSHTSGIGDYIDDDADDAEYLLPIPVSSLRGPEDYLGILDGHPPVAGVGESFTYCNAGYVILALIAERLAGTPFQDLVQTRVIEPARMTHTAYCRSDDLPGDAASGYVKLDGQWRSNVHHLPIVGSGDGGAYSTVADLHAFWTALFRGDIVTLESVTAMTADRVPGVGGPPAGYGLGFWLHGSGVISLEGADAGVSMYSIHHRASSTTATVLANDGDGAWPFARLMIDRLPWGD